MKRHLFQERVQFNSKTLPDMKLPTALADSIRNEKEGQIVLIIGCVFNLNYNGKEIADYYRVTAE